MLFNSYGFIFLFLPLVLLGYFGLRARGWERPSLIFLSVSSAIFYGWWNFPYLILIGGLIVFNFLFSSTLGGRSSKLLLTLGVIVNLLVLAYFKYANFFIENLNVVFRQSWTWTEVLLPLGLSFHTFQQIEYLVSVHRGMKRERDFARYSLFVLFFPQLIAGPLVLYREIAWQFDKLRGFRFVNLAAGLSMFTVGLAKKVLVADSLSQVASPLFQMAEQGEPLSPLMAWKAAIAYGLQIYFDFSGYSDMAIGLARMFGIQLPANFNSPYKAQSIIEFWRRWHITLSRFLRDYVYIPLGGNRGGLPRQYSNLLMTMLIGGLWHGASWNFVIWGGLHGLFLVANHLWRQVFPRKGGKSASAWPVRIFCTAATFAAVMVAWIFFRAPTLDGALHMFSSLVGPWQQNDPAMVFDSSVITILAALAIVWGLPNLQQLMGRTFAGMAIYPASPAVGHFFRWKPNLTWGLLLGLAFASSLFAISKASEFIYFNF